MVLNGLRYILGFIFLYAGGSKVFEPMLFKAVIENYFAIPDILALMLAILVPWIQIFAALALILKWYTLYSSGLLLIMSVFFFGLMVVNYGQVLPFGCGCFGFNDEEIVGLYHVARDFFIALLAFIVVYDSYRKVRTEKRKSNISIEY